MSRARAAALAALTALGACDGDDPTPAFPADYLASFVEVRDCRGSADHDLLRVRVLVDPASVDAYQQRDRPFPVGAIVLKEEHDFADMDCAGPVERWTVMERLPDGAAPDALDWRWQEVDAARAVVREDAPRCIGCHQACGAPPDGYLGTCTVP